MTTTDKPTGAHNPYAKPLDLRPMLTQSPPKLNHILPGLLAGTVGALVAPGGTGKTMLLLQTALAVATATPLCGGLFDDVPPECARPITPLKVVFVTAEEPEEVIWHRLHAAMRQLLPSTHPLLDKNAAEELLDMLARNLHVYAMLGKPGTTLFDGDHARTLALQQLTEACDGAGLVLLDPLRQFHRGDENDSGAVTAVVQGLQALAARTGASVVVAHHTNRVSTNMGTGDTAGAARGSTALTDGVRWQLNLSRVSKEVAREHGINAGDEGRFVRVDFAKVNYLPPLPSRILKRGAGGALSVYALDTVRRSENSRAPRGSFARSAGRAVRAG